MRQDKHCCYQNDKNIILTRFCLQLLIWSLWASQINSVIHPGILPAPKEIPSKTVEKLSLGYFQICEPLHQKGLQNQHKNSFCIFPSAHLSGGTLNQFLTQLICTS